MSLGIFFIIFAVLIVVGLPIGVGIAMTAIVPSLVNSGFSANAQLVIRSMLSGIDSFPLLAVPMFIISGIVMARGKISEKLFNMFAYFIGTRSAGMPIAAIITCLFYGAISGSGPATTAAVGSMTIPILVSLGYDKTFVTAMIAVAGGLGVIIPPSIPFIFYGMSSGESVGALFIGGVLPGILIGAILSVYAYYYCKKKGEDKEKLEKFARDIRSKGFWGVFKDSFWALLSPVIILGSIYSGVASPTEAAVISVFYSLFISIFIYKTLKVKDLIALVNESVVSYTPILFILAAAMGFARVLIYLRAPQIVATGITSIVSSKVGVLLVINVLLLFVGMVMDTTPAILILTPILLPIAQAVGVDPIHFGIIMVVNLAIGFVTPPMGVNLFVASSMTDIPIIKIAKAALPFIICFLIALVFITFIPEISLLLVR
jgi:C4-dicarboxylate transporter DctM subunit